MLTKEQITNFINSKENAWSPTTRKKVQKDLEKYAPYITGEPEVLWNAISHLGAYSKVTLWTRVTKFWDSMSDDNNYRHWREQNARQFKYAYERKTPELSFKEAYKALQKIKDNEVRAKALQLLVGGLRWSESFTVEDGHCTGKGGKKRRVFVGAVDYTKSKSHFEQKLHEALPGITPHDLRKIRMTDLARQGLRPEDLCKIAGWSNFNTAASYIAPQKDETLAKLFKV